MTAALLKTRASLVKPEKAKLPATPAAPVTGRVKTKAPGVRIDLGAASAPVGDLDREFEKYE